MIEKDNAIDAVATFLSSKNLHIVSRIAKGWTSFVYLVQNSNGERFVLKVLREKSNRRDMPRRESENLKIANSIGIGPKFAEYFPQIDAVLMEYIDGKSFSEWLFEDISKVQLEKFLKSLLLQAQKLDKIGLDHGQLAGKGHNILVRKGVPVIIDFEKASRVRKVHNVNVLQSVLFKSRGAVVKRILFLLGR